MFGFMADCLARATLLATGMECVLLLLGIRSARVRHIIWTAATLVMLALPVLRLLDVGPRVRVPLPMLSESPAQLPAGDQMSDAAEPSPIVKSSGVIASLLNGSTHVQEFAIAVYALGALFLLWRLAWGTWRTRRLLRSSSYEDGVLVSPACASPVTAGWWAPRIVLPPHFGRWPADQLRAVLAHEQEHARWRDPLAQWCALLNRCLFWVHPAAWWMERRLAELAEDACDHAVLRQGYSAVAYSDFLLDCATAVQEREFGMGIGGRGLARRIPRILASSSGMPPDGRWRAALAALLCGAVAVGTTMLSVQVVTVMAAAPAAVDTGIDPLPVVILTPVRTSLTAVAAPAEQGAVMSSVQRSGIRNQRLTEIYFDLAGMSEKERAESGIAVRKWLRELPNNDAGREIRVLVNTGKGAEIALDSTSDLGRVTKIIDLLLADRASLPVSTVQARMDSVESVVQELLELQGQRDLVCVLGGEFTVPTETSRHVRPHSVRFIRNSFFQAS